MIDLFYIIVGIGFVLSLLVQGWLKNTYARWSKVRNSQNLGGAGVARRVLDRNQMSEYHIALQTGYGLIDHYDPRSKTVCLSERIYREPSVASAAVGAHDQRRAKGAFEPSPEDFKTRAAFCVFAGAHRLPPDEKIVQTPGT